MRVLCDVLSIRCADGELFLNDHRATLYTDRVCVPITLYTAVCRRCKDVFWPFLKDKGVYYLRTHANDCRRNVHALDRPSVPTDRDLGLVVGSRRKDCASISNRDLGCRSARCNEGNASRQASFSCVHRSPLSGGLRNDIAQLISTQTDFRFEFLEQLGPHGLRASLMIMPMFCILHGFHPARVFIDGNRKCTYSLRDIDFSTMVSFSTSLLYLYCS